DGVDGDAIMCPACCQVTRHVDDGSFASMVADDLEIFGITTDEARNGGNVDDFATLPTSNHGVSDKLAHDECSFDVDIHYLSKFIQRHLLWGGTPGCTAIIDQDVNGPEMLLCGLNNLFSVALPSYITGQGESFTTSSLYLSLYFFTGSEFA